MNNQRRKKIKEGIQLLERAKALFEEVTDEENEAYDNLPEGLQDSEKGETMLDNTSILETQGEAIDDIISELEEV